MLSNPFTVEFDEMKIDAAFAKVNIGSSAHRAPSVSFGSTSLAWIKEGHPTALIEGVYIPIEPDDGGEFRPVGIGAT